jgi:hypothetical protein
MNKQHIQGLRFRRNAFLVIPLLLSLLGASAVAAEIDACKYLVVTDFTADPYGIAKELRTQAQLKGFTVISAVTEVTPTDRLKTCVMTGSWNREPDASSAAEFLRVSEVDYLGIVREPSTPKGKARPKLRVEPTTKEHLNGLVKECVAKYPTANILLVPVGEKFAEVRKKIDVIYGE